MKKDWRSKILLVFLGLFLVLGLEGALRISGFGENFDFVLEGASPSHSDQYSLNSQYVALHYFSHLPIRLPDLFQDDPWFPETAFAKKKGARAYRIFVLGASTTRGFPFSSREISFSGILEDILQDVLPGHEVEVINAGYDALSSFGVLDLFRQLVHHDPDLILVYSGHNEFIGHFGVNSTVNYGGRRALVDLVLHLHPFRLFLLNELLLLKLESLGKPEPSRESGINLFKVMLKKEKITWTRQDHRISEDHYAENLDLMAQLGKRMHIPVVFMTLVSNVRDFPPLRSEHRAGLTPDQKQQVRTDLQRGRVAREHHELEKALAYILHSVTVDPSFSKAHFELARTYEALSDYPHARQEYRLAREYDKVHLRACRKFNRIIHRVARRHGVPVVEIGEAFEEVSPHHLPGDNLFLEHVHPNINGHLIMADTLSHFLARRDFIEPEPNWQWGNMHKAEDYVRSSGFDRQEWVRSRATVGRLLLDFPFYRCEKGEAFLKSIGRDESEKKLIRECYRNRSGAFAGAAPPKDS